MSRGSRRRKSTAAPSTLGETPAVSRRLWFVATEKDSVDQDSLVEAARSAAKSNGWLFSMRRSQPRRVLGGEQKDRPYRLLSTGDARDIYQDLHVRDCLILVTHRCHIKADPSKDPTSLRELVLLADFVLHKAAFHLVRGVSDVVTSAGGFVSWPAANSCLGRHDPRIVPMHVFDSTRRWRGLDSEQGRSDFDRHYGLRGGSRRDVRGHEWRQPNALHGRVGAERAPLRVAGVPLEPGYHWDVQKGVGGSGTLLSESEVWKLRRENAYLNVYPNGHLRGDPKFGARRVWPK